MKSNKVFFWAMRIIPAIIMLQTLYFKFTGAPESIYIFTTIGMEPWGRYGSGFAEAIAAILLLIPRFSGFGGFIGCAVLSGALFFHLTSLGIEVQDDGGLLFAYAVVTFMCSAVVFLTERHKLLKLIGK